MKYMYCKEFFLFQLAPIITTKMSVLMGFPWHISLFFSFYNDNNNKNSLF